MNYNSISFFFSPLVLVDYAILLGCALFITHKRVQEHINTANFGRVLLAFFGTLIAMFIPSGAIGFFLWAVFFDKGAFSPSGAGGAVLEFFFGPALCFLFGLVASLPLGSWISHVFWKQEQAPED